MQERLLNAKEVSERLGVCLRTVRSFAASGDLPPSVRLGKRLVRWRESDLAKWIENGLRLPATRTLNARSR